MILCSGSSQDYFSHDIIPNIQFRLQIQYIKVVFHHVGFCTVKELLTFEENEYRSSCLQEAVDHIRCDSFSIS